MEGTMRGWAVVLVCVSGCYTGSRATRDANEAWRGQSRAALEARWGPPSEVGVHGDTTVLTYTRHWRSVRLPSASAELVVRDDGFEAHAEVRPGQVRRGATQVVVDVDAAGVVLNVDGPSLRRGPPNEAYLHWGTLLGLHAGMGRLDDTSTWLPSGGAYIGGMLSPTVGLVGTFTLAAGIDDDGGAMGFAWGLAAQWWPATRLSVRAGPAAVLAFDPGFENVGFEPAAAGAVSYAVVKRGTFALDLRMDLTAGTSTAFATAGVGVNLN